MAARTRDPRAELELQIQAGRSLEEITRMIDRMNLPEAERDTLWLWASTYWELRPISIFDKRGRMKGDNK